MRSLSERDFQDRVGFRWVTHNFFRFVFTVFDRREIVNFMIRRHLREKHSVVEGGSFVCRYGYNSVCNSLPVEGVSDSDYFHHVVKHHALLPVIPRYERGKLPVEELRGKKNDGNLFLLSPGDSSETSGRKPSGSVGPAEPALESDGRWTLFSAKQNLATVLNDPNRGKQKDCFTKHWGPDFVEKTPDQVPKHPRLPDVDRSHFESYLKKIAKVRTRFAGSFSISPTPIPFFSSVTRGTQNQTSQSRNRNVPLPRKSFTPSRR